MNIDSDLFERFVIAHERIANSLQDIADGDGFASNGAVVEFANLIGPNIQGIADGLSVGTGEGSALDRIADALHNLAEAVGHADLQPNIVGSLMDIGEALRRK